MRQIPAAATPGRRTPVFDVANVPPALLGNHHTSVWAELVVVEGTVEFVEAETDFNRTVGAGEALVIVPERRHRVVLGAGASFYVQFYDLDQSDQPSGRPRQNRN